MCVNISLCTCRGQRTACRSKVFFFFFPTMRVPCIKLRLDSKCLYPLSHLIGPVSHSFLISCVSILPPCICMDDVGVWCLLTSKEGVRFSGTEVADGYELQCGCW